MDASYLARLALSRLPRPYSEEIILHVFCEIERTPHLLGEYMKLLQGQDAYMKQGLNSQVAKTVRETLNADTHGERIDTTGGICTLVDGVSRLRDIESDWSWEANVGE